MNKFKSEGGGGGGASDLNRGLICKLCDFLLPPTGKELPPPPPPAPASRFGLSKI